MNGIGTTNHVILIEQIKAEIASGNIRPGDKLPSENELSARYHMSRHMVRKALQVMAQEGYVEAIHGKGTFCRNQEKEKRRTYHIGVLTTYRSDYIFPRLIQGIDRIMEENGYHMILKNTGNSRQHERIYLEELLHGGMDGLILEPSKSQLICKHMNLYEKMDSEGIPYVFMNGRYDQMEEKPHILMDDCLGGYLVTKHLIDLGHRNIVGIFKADDSQGKERHKGYVKALQEAGMLYDPDMVIWFHTEDRATKPFWLMDKMMEQGIKVDGIVCYNDQTAVKMIRTLKEKGLRVPEDISITGYDNSAMAEGEGFNLTTIVHPQEKLGEMAAELLLEQIRQGPEAKRGILKLIEPELIVRGSCKDRGNRAMGKALPSPGR